MTREIRPLARALSLQPATVPGARRAWRGAGRVAAVVGIGPESAGPSTEQLLDAVEVDRVLVIGVAGAVDPTLHIGDVVVPAQVIDRATGAVFQAHRSGAHGTLVTSNAIGGVLAPDDISTGAGGDPPAVAELPTEDLPPGTSAVDMETAAIARACEASGVPWAAVRTISDLPGTLDNSVLELVGPDGGLDPVAVARLLARRPGEVAQLMRLGRDTQRAVHALTQAALAEL